MKSNNKRQTMPEHQPVYAQHLEVTFKPGESYEKLIKRFMKKVRNDGILQEVIEKSRFMKPSVKKKRKSSKARFLAKKELEKNLKQD